MQDALGNQATREVPVGQGHFGEAIRRLRELRRLSLDDLATRADLNKDTVWRAEQMATPDIRPRTFHKLAHGLAVTPEKLERIWRHAGDDDPLDLRTAGTVPGYDGLPASPPRYVGEADEYNCDFTISRDLIERSGITDPMAYTVVVRGDSMEPTLANGDLVVVSPSPVHEVGVESGKIYAIFFAGEGDGTIKRVIVRPGTMWLLQPDNAKHDPIEVNSSEIAGMALVAGKMTLLQELPAPTEHYIEREANPEHAEQFNAGKGPLRSAADVSDWLTQTRT